MTSLTFNRFFTAGVIALALLLTLFSLFPEMFARVGLSPGTIGVLESSALVEGASCACTKGTICDQLRLSLVGACEDIKEACGDDCFGDFFDPASVDRCATKKNELSLSEQWYAQQCGSREALGCGDPLEPCCEESPRGACCTLLYDGTVDCHSNVPETSCSLAHVQEKHPEVQRVIFHEGKTCDQVNCGYGACCMTSQEIDICEDHLTLLQCRQRAQQLGLRASWRFDKTCGEVDCTRYSCRDEYTDAYTGSSCQECRSSFCQDPDHCWSWCTEEPDDFGLFCCGPV